METDQSHEAGSRPFRKNSPSHEKGSRSYRKDSPSREARSKSNPANLILAVYPINPKNAIPISKSIQKVCKVKLDSPILPLNLSEKLGKLIIKDSQIRKKVLDEYKNIEEDIIISTVNSNFIVQNFGIIKNLKGILINDNKTLDISNLRKRTKSSINLDREMQTILFILAVATFEHRKEIKRIIFDDNEIGNPNCFYSIPFLFENVESISIKGNKTKTAKISGNSIKVEGADDDDDGGGGDDDDDGESDQNQKKFDLIVPISTIIFNPPPSLPPLDKRFQMVIDNKDQDEYFKSMMLSLFDPQSEVGDKFYDPTAVFSFTISENIASKNYPLYNFLKANECNLINISNANHKKLGTNFFCENSDVFPKGMRSSQEEVINVMPTVAIGSQLFAVVVHTTLEITYKFEGHDDDPISLKSIHTFTIRSDGEDAHILSHQMFLHE